MALQTPEQQAKLLDTLFQAAYRDAAGPDPVDFTDPDAVWIRLKQNVAELGLRLAIVDATWDLPAPVSAAID